MLQLCQYSVRVRNRHLQWGLVCRTNHFQRRYRYIGETVIENNRSCDLGRFFSSKICHEVNLLPSQSEGCVKDQMDGVTSITCNCQSEFCNDADKLRSFPEMRELPLIPRDSNYTVARNLTDNFNVSSTSTNTTDFNSTENQNAIASMYRTTTSTNHPYHIG